MLHQNYFSHTARPWDKQHGKKFFSRKIRRVFTFFRLLSTHQRAAFTKYPVLFPENSGKKNILKRFFRRVEN
jgi:hypothetical protein